MDAEASELFYLGIERNADGMSVVHGHWNTSIELGVYNAAVKMTTVQTVSDMRHGPRKLAMCKCILSLAVWLFVGTRLLWAALPTFDHIVIVIEENKGRSDVIGNTSEAPFINNVLAGGGASLANFFAVSHPSQPNYLQFFSGSNQGIVDNTVPAPGAPFSTPNLGAELLAAGKSFVGYSEDLPEVGSMVTESGFYARRHNPWVNWQFDSPGTNQLLPTVNQPFSSFPDSAHFDDLPSVAIIVPNNANNMHDGTIAQGDAWLQSNISAYASWAKQHNSLLVVTYDEDSDDERNRVPTMFYGAHVAAGRTVQSTVTAHNLLRTIEDLSGALHSGSAAQVRSIVGPFTTTGPYTIVSFQQGANHYASALDTYLDQANPDAVHSGDAVLATGGASSNQVLLRFDNLVGAGAGQIPSGAQVLSAKLVLNTNHTELYSADQTISLHTLNVPFDSTSTWNSMAGGIGIGTEAKSAAEFTLFPNNQGDRAIFDVTEWAQSIAGGSQNFGWVLNSDVGGIWLGESSESPYADLRRAWRSRMPAR